MSYNNKSPRERFEELKKTIIQTIDQIDKDTPWENTEPQWWLDMMELRKNVNNQPHK